MSSKQSPTKLTRRLTSPLRVSPGFLIIGAQKAGTTSLYDHLIQHPSISRSISKEIHYFDSPNYDRGPSWYLSHFHRKRKVTDHFKSTGRLSYMSGEASPYYLAHPSSPARAHRFNPDFKLIVMLRNPIDRALSHYNHQVRQGVETLSFSDALAQEESRLAGEREKMIADSNYYSNSYWSYSYIERGRYDLHLRNWLSTFDRSQLLVLNSETFFRNPQAVFSETVEFLQLSAHKLASVSPKNSGGAYAKMPTATRNYLRGQFSEHNAALKELVDYEPTWD